MTSLHDAIDILIKREQNLLIRIAYILLLSPEVDTSAAQTPKPA